MDLNGDGDTSDQIAMSDIYTACGEVAASSAPTSSSERSNCPAPWRTGISLYRDTRVCDPYIFCGPNDQAFYLDINGGNSNQKNYSDTCARPTGIMGAGDNGGQSATWQGTGYFDGTSEVKFQDYYLDCSTCVIFIEGDPANPTKNIFRLEDQDCSRTFIRVEAFVTALGDGHVHAKGIKGYQVTVPTGAWKQYVAGTVTSGSTPDTAAVNEYPADNGLNTSSGTWNLPDSRFDGNATGVVFHGFLSPYTFSCGGGDNIVVGSIYGRKEGTKEVSANTFIIYYDSATATNIRYSDPGVQRVSWREIKTNW